MNEVAGLVGGATKKRSKHVELDEAINSLGKLAEHARKVLESISDEDSCVGASGDGPKITPSLEQVLNGGSERIRDYCNQVHKALEEISQRLF